MLHADNTLQEKQTSSGYLFDFRDEKRIVSRKKRGILDFDNLLRFMVTGIRKIGFYFLRIVYSHACVTIRET